MPDPYEEALERLREAEAGGEEEEEPTGLQLDDLIGRTFIDPTTQTQGVLKTRIDRGTGKRVYWFSDPKTGRAFNLGASPTLMDATSFQMFTLTPTGKALSGGKASEWQLETLGLLGGAGTGSPAWSSTQAAQTQADAAAMERLRAQIAQDQASLAENRRQFDIAQANEDRRLMQQLQAQIDLEEMRIENSKRELVYTMGMQERGTLIQEKAETGREIMRMGPDPFKQWSYLGGGVQRGVTPQQTAVKQGQAFMQQPLPEVSMDMDVAQLEQALAQMQGQGMSQPQFGPGFGMAQGGVIEMERGGDGAFSRKPSQRETYLVGDGAGIIPGVTEALTVEKGPFGIKSVEVTPLAGAAQGGMNIGGLQALSPLYTDFNFPPATDIPQARIESGYGIMPKGGWNTGGYRHPETFSQMGIQPKFVRFGGNSAIFMRDQSGQLQHLAPGVFPGSGYRYEDIMTFDPSARDQFTFGDTSITKPIPAFDPREPGAFGARARPLIESSTGAVLPAIHKIARQLAQWRAAGDWRYDMALSAYGNALDPETMLPHGGLSQQYIDSIIDAATPQAGAFGGRRIGFTGGFM